MDINRDTKVLITGASSGIGRCLALKLASYGAKIALVARRKERLESTAEEVKRSGGIPLVIPADVTVKEQAAGAVRKAIEEFDGLDILVNNAGRGNLNSVEDTPDGQIESMFELNVFSLWYTTREALPVMREQNRGQIINVSSMAGKTAFPFNSAYIAAKHAAVGFTAALRTELIDTDIDAMVVCPMGVMTEWGDVTEGGPISQLFGKGLKYADEIAAGQGVEKPSKHFIMLKPKAVADRIIHAIKNPQSDIYTHPGSREMAMMALQDRQALERNSKPLFLGMKKAYKEIRQKEPAGV